MDSHTAVTVGGFKGQNPLGFEGTHRYPQLTIYTVLYQHRTTEVTEIPSALYHLHLEDAESRDRWMTVTRSPSWDQNPSWEDSGSQALPNCTLLSAFFPGSKGPVTDRPQDQSAVLRNIKQESFLSNTKTNTKSTKSSNLCISPTL